MIDFKQWDSWGNNFNNWDEAKLSDANRPRDQFWLRINPWKQMDKWDYRWSNKNLLEYFVVQWGIEITGIAQAQMNYLTSVNIPLNKDNKWRFSYTGNYYYTIEQFEEISGSETTGSIRWLVKDWRVYIPEDWNYLIQYLVEFNWQQWTTTDTATQAPKLHAQPCYFNKKWEKVWPFTNTDRWWIMNPDICEWLTLQYLKTWESISIDAIHWRNWVKAFCRGCVKLLKLS